MEKIRKIIRTVAEMFCSLCVLVTEETIRPWELQLTPYWHPFSLLDPDNHRNQKDMVIRDVVRVRWP